MSPAARGVMGCALAALALAAAAQAAPRSIAAGVTPPPRPFDDVDEQRAAWRHRRHVEVGDPGGRALAALVLPPELRARCQPDLRDLRLVDARGREVAYAVDRLEPRAEAAAEWSGALVDARREAERESQWVIDLGAPRTFEQVAFDVAGDGFAKRVRLEASDDGRTWSVLRAEASLFARDWNGPVRRTDVDLDAPATARFVRLSADDRRSPPVNVTGAHVRGVRRLRGARWRLDAPLAAADGRSRWRVDLPPGLPIETVELDAADATFARQVRLVEKTGGGEQTLGEARLFRVRLDDPALAAETLRFDVRRPAGGELAVVIDDGDSPPLHGLRVSVGGLAERLLFPAAAGEYTLYYANAATRAPLYDLATLRGRLTFAPDVVPALLGDEQANPRYAPAPPLAFVATAGAPLDAARWRFARPFGVGREDIYSLTLDPDDLARLHDGLGDLRIADAQGRQVPYILEPAAAEAHVALHVEHETARRAGRQAAAVTRLQLSRPDEGGGAARQGLPLAALELDFTEAFFSRPLRVLAAGRRGGETEIQRGTLARTAEARAPLVVALDGRRHAVLWLEIDDGDNAPLTLTSAHARVRVPRVTFKAVPGDYRLLLGHDEPAAPRYDLAALRRELLAYSALPAELGTTADNPAYRRRAADYFKDAPPTLLMWGTLAAAVAALLLLTVRLLRKAAG